jgi:3-methyladenine DNA glycosylase AlkC
MLNRTDRDLLKAVGKNPSTPVQSLQKLAKNSDYYIRLGVAQNSAAPASLLRQLADDDEPSVRTSVANNKSTDISIVRELAVDKDGGVAMTAREALRKRGLSEGRLRHLIRQMI